MGTVPGLALAYLVLTGMLLNRVRPSPITIFPRLRESGEQRLPAEAAA